MDQGKRHEVLLALGITQMAIQECLSSGDVDQANEALSRLKASARKRFRQLSIGIHPDHSDDPADHERFKFMNEAMDWLERLSVSKRHPQPQPQPQPCPQPHHYQPYSWGTYTSTTTASTVGYVGGWRYVFVRF